MKTSVAVEFWDEGRRSSRRSSTGFASEADAVADLQGLGDSMQDAVARSGGREARRRHRYQNRTHNLERSTDAYLTKDSPNAVEVRLEPLAEYAIYVARRGYLDMTKAGEMGEAALDRLVDKLDT